LDEIGVFEPILQKERFGFANLFDVLAVALIEKPRRCGTTYGLRQMTAD
jgi:hypothetical protein